MDPRQAGDLPRTGRPGAPGGALPPGAFPPGILNRCADRVGGVGLGRRGQPQNILGLKSVAGGFAGHFEHSLGEGAGFIRRNHGHILEGIDIVGPLDQNPPAGCTAYAAEIAQRHRDNQGAGAGNHQHHQRPIHRIRQGDTGQQQGRQEGRQNRDTHDNGGVNRCEPGNELLGGRLSRRGILNQFEDA